MFARHLLALFALLSGLAALEVPVHAQVSPSAVQNARSVAGSVQGAASESCTSSDRARDNGGEQRKRESKRQWSWLPSWLLPSTILGSDRALE